MGQQIRLMQHLALPMSESRGRLSQTLLAPLLRDSIPLAKDGSISFCEDIPWLVRLKVSRATNVFPRELEMLHQLVAAVPLAMRLISVKGTRGFAFSI